VTCLRYLVRERERALGIGDNSARTSPSPKAPVTVVAIKPQRH
jgi:hypothetical protein